MTTEWNASEYHRLSGPQVAWGQRVLERVTLAGNERVLDLGCGTGRVTAALLDRLPRGLVIGLDQSRQMLDEARRHLPRDRARLIRASLPRIPLRNAVDLVFSTATFHWVLDHPALFRAIAGALVPGGWLVAQCGGAGNLDRLHARAEALMRSPRFARWFTAWTPPWEFADAGTTASRLEAAGFDEIDTWLEDSPVTLEDAERFGDFLTTVILRDHLRYLPGAEERRAFVAELTRQAGSDEPPFLLDYVRLNIRARMARMRNG